MRANGEALVLPVALPFLLSKQTLTIAFDVPLKSLG